MKKTFYIILSMWYLLSANTTFAFTHADTLRGSNGRGRDWWDVQYYDLSVIFDTASRSIKGVTKIEFSLPGLQHDSMQIDLQSPMVLDSAVLGVGADRGCLLQIINEGNVWWLKGAFNKLDKNGCVTLYYHGTPRIAVNPPWDGGFSWKTDSEGKPWMSVSCQGLGASVWWPCKDAQWDEPDMGMKINLKVPQGMVAVSNGRLKGQPKETTGEGYWSWEVKNPINNYDVSFYIGNYVHWQDTLIGEKGKLDLDYWVLRQNEQKAHKQFVVVKQMIHCFEYWMGPYPFYEDGYKLVDAPYLGMEHQGAVAYGNDYKMGYRGYDRTMTGIGMNFDYIIIHESGHEWFGNNVTAADMADNWVHEGITTYSESLFAECLLGKEKGQKYCRGEWRNIQNDKPMIGPYGVNEEGSNDIYDKGTAIMYMIRMMTNDDEKFRQMLRGLGKEFYHKTVTTQQVESYIASHTGLDLTAFFNQYLRTTDIPVIEYSIRHKKMRYRFVNTVNGFTLPLTVTANNITAPLTPTTEWQEIKWKGGFDIKFTKDFLIKTEK